MKDYNIEITDYIHDLGDIQDVYTTRRKKRKRKVIR